MLMLCAEKLDNVKKGNSKNFVVAAIDLVTVKFIE